MRTMEISGNFDFMISFCQLSPKKSEKWQKMQDFRLYFGLNNQNEAKMKLFYKPLKGQKSCPWQNQVLFRVLRGN